MTKSLVVMSLASALVAVSTSASAQTANCNWYADTALKQQQPPFTAREAERIHAEVRQVLHVPRIGDEQPADLSRNGVPQTFATSQATSGSEHL